MAQHIRLFGFKPLIILGINMCYPLVNECKRLLNAWVHREL